MAHVQRLVPLLVLASLLCTSGAAWVSVGSVKELQQALADQAVAEIRVTRDLTFTDSNWPATLVVDVASGRNVTVGDDCTKKNSTWSFIDFGLIRNRIQVHRDTWLTWQCLWIGNYRWALATSPGKCPHVND